MRVGSVSMRSWLNCSISLEALNLNSSLRSARLDRGS